MLAAKPGQADPLLIMNFVWNIDIAIPPLQTHLADMRGMHEHHRRQSSNHRGHLVHAMTLYVQPRNASRPDRHARAIHAGAAAGS